MVENQIGTLEPKWGAKREIVTDMVTKADPIITVFRIS